MSFHDDKRELSELILFSKVSIAIVSGISFIYGGYQLYNIYTSYKQIKNKRR